MSRTLLTAVVLPISGTKPSGMAGNLPSRVWNRKKAQQKAQKRVTGRKRKNGGRAPVHS